MRKISRKIKINSKLVVIICIALFFLILSVGYSYLQTQIKIEGKATIVPQEQLVQYPKGESICTYKVLPIANIDSTVYSYDVTLNIVNNDENTKNWTIAFSVPSSFKEILADGKTNYENGRVILYHQSNNGDFEKGSTQTINFKINLNKNEKLILKNLTLNGLLTELEDVN